MKWRLFQTGFKSKQAVHHYLWHIARRRESGYVDRHKGLTDYLPAARTLMTSMAKAGFSPQRPVPVDKNGDILDGAHRVACALALGINVEVQLSDRLAWAPAWDAAWFRQMGMSQFDVQCLLEDMEKLKLKPFNGPGPRR